MSIPGERERVKFIRCLFFDIDERWKLHCFSKNIPIVLVYLSHLFKNIKAGSFVFHLVRKENQLLNFLDRFQKPLHVSELYTMKHVIDIQDYGGNRVARLLPAFRLRFDENNIQVNPLSPPSVRITSFP